MDKNILELILKYEDDPLALLNATGGYYECIKNAEGQRLNRMVGYKGTYKGEDNKMLQYVGDTYHNISKIEQYPLVLDHLASRLFEKVHFGLSNIASAKNLFFVGPHDGGASLAQMICRRFPNAQYAGIDMSSDSSGSVVFKKHHMPSGSFVIVVKNVLNNFVTTKKIIEKIKADNSLVCGIASIVNRSMDKDKERKFLYENIDAPIISLIYKPQKEYRQDDPEVAEYVKSGRICFNPQDDWENLVSSHNRMQANSH